MERTEEFRGIIRLHGVELPKEQDKTATSLSPALHIAKKIAGILSEIESVIDRMTKL
jgi:hypothetical protein